jgi:hypothetical protein
MAVFDKTQNRYVPVASVGDRESCSCSYGETCWEHNLKVQELTRSLVGRSIRKAAFHETNGRAFVELTLDDGREVQAGVSGNLHDEAYLVFKLKDDRYTGA